LSHNDILLLSLVRILRLLTGQLDVTALIYYIGGSN